MMQSRRRWPYGERSMSAADKIQYRRRRNRRFVIAAARQGAHNVAGTTPPVEGHRAGETSMSSTISTSTPLSSPTELEPLRAKSGWIIALGIVYVIAGLVALGSVVFATVATVFVVGIMMLIAGTAEVVNAFQIKTWGKFLFWLLLGALYIVAGFVTFENPLLAAAFLTLLLGFSLIASGIMRMVLGFSMRQGTPWLWVVFSGVIRCCSAS
jgi:uncharacterized membrane protein HdeD (DUF308 family)